MFNDFCYLCWHGSKCSGSPSIEFFFFTIMQSEPPSRSKVDRTGWEKLDNEPVDGDCVLWSDDKDMVLERTGCAASIRPRGARGGKGKKGGMQAMVLTVCGPPEKLQEGRTEAWRLIELNKVTPGRMKPESPAASSAAAENDKFSKRGNIQANRTTTAKAPPPEQWFRFPPPPGWQPAFGFRPPPTTDGAANAVATSMATSTTTTAAAAAGLHAASTTTRTAAAVQ